MNTDDLIARLSADVMVAPRRADPAATIFVAAGMAVAAMGLMFVLGYGVRPRLLAALTTPFTLAKTFLPLAAALVLFPSIIAAARPGAPPSRIAWAAAIFPAVALALFVAEWVVTPAPARAIKLVGHSIPVCLPSIALLSVPMLAGLILAMRRAAPVRPTRAGMLAGLVAGCASAALYSLYCTVDTPLFYVLWYSTGVAIVTLAGAVAGRSLLRW